MRQPGPRCTTPARPTSRPAKRTPKASKPSKSSTDPTPTPVTLTLAECLLACQVGTARQLSAIVQGKQNSHGFRGQGFDIHILGAAGELALAKALGIYWTGHINTFKQPDLGTNIQVRTRSSHTYDLIVRDGDADDELFVLVTGTLPAFHIWGWIRGGDAKQREYLKTYGSRPEAFFVPHDALHPLATLRS